jgi:hypothetical protein
MPNRLFPWLSRAIASGCFQPGDHQQIHDLIIVGLVVAVNDHGAPAGGQSDEILELNKQMATIGHMNGEGSKRLGMKQLPNFLCLHLTKR